MKHLLKYDEMILETLRSDKIEIVNKKIRNFFNNLGFIEKKFMSFDKIDSPYYTIYSDRNSIMSQISEYEYPKKSRWDFVRKWTKTKSGRQKIEKLLNTYKQALIDFEYGDIFISYDGNTPDILSDFIHLIDTTGYFIATATVPNEDHEKGRISDKSKIYDICKNHNKVMMSIEPNYDKQVDFKGKYLYHTTNKENLDKILKVGLIPKTKNTRSFYPDRIYLSPDVKYMDSIKDQLSGDKGGEYVKMRIRNFPGLKLYKDVRFKGGFYTYDNIHPKYIQIIE